VQISPTPFVATATPLEVKIGARASPSLARIRAISAKNTHPRDAHVACMDLTF
jgi:hypothetical protein